MSFQCHGTFQCDFQCHNFILVQDVCHVRLRPGGLILALAGGREGDMGPWHGGPEPDLLLAYEALLVGSLKALGAALLVSIVSIQ